MSDENDGLLAAGKAARTEAAKAAGDSLRAICPICPHHCSLAEGQLGICHARRARDGQVVCENYGRLTSIALDPIEKKPLARFHPGSMILSVGSYGCNMHCPWCQNASISQAGPDDSSYRQTSPEELVEYALGTRGQGNIGIAYTYNEPLVSYEYVLDCSRLAHENGLLNVLVSNGMACADKVAELAPFIDAANIDLKCWDAALYKKSGGDLETVKSTIQALAATSHVEVTTLLITELNDSAEEVEGIARWLADVDPDITYHLSRFFPCYKMTDRGPTPVETVYVRAKEARRYLRHVYTGNC